MVAIPDLANICSVSSFVTAWALKCSNASEMSSADASNSAEYRLINSYEMLVKKQQLFFIY